VAQQTRSRRTPARSTSTTARRTAGASRRGAATSRDGATARAAAEAPQAQPRQHPGVRRTSPPPRTRRPDLLGRLAAAVALELRRRVPRADLDERDPDFIRDNLPFLWMFSTLYHRAEVRGLDNIPEEGPVLLVGNHSGGNMIVDTFVFTFAFTTRFGVERPFYQLAHNLVLLLGPLMPWIPDLRRFGTVAAGHDNAERALSSGAAVLVYPGGDYETHRPSWESARVDFGGRKGFIRLALKNRVPIVPVVAVGGQETALFLSRGERLARLLRLDRMFRLKVLPISLALPWGLNIGDMLTHIPLPAKITVEALPPIDIRRQFGDNPDIDAVYDHVVGEMQRSLSGLAAERRFPVIG
jgi:1-acyl-sn-glycerol-3-phosphate acyltransferase